MMRLFLLLLIVAAAWYGWKNYGTLFERRPNHEAYVENASGIDLNRVRVVVDGQTLVKETLPSGSHAAMPFRVNNDSAFELTWQMPDGAERRWSGGMVPRGPMVQRHKFRIDPEGVIYQAENK